MYCRRCTAADVLPALTCDVAGALPEVAGLKAGPLPEVEQLLGEAKGNTQVMQPDGLPAHHTRSAALVPSSYSGTMQLPFRAVQCLTRQVSGPNLPAVHCMMIFRCSDA